MPARRSNSAWKKQSSVGVKAVSLKPANSSATTASRFVACPACDLHVPSHCINEHLDSACTAAVAAQPNVRRSVLSKGLKIITMLHYNSSSCRTDKGWFDPLTSAAGPAKKAKSSTSSQWWRHTADSKAAPAALGKVTGNAQKVPLTAAELSNAVPCELVPDVLPRELADKLLQVGFSHTLSPKNEQRGLVGEVDTPSYVLLQNSGGSLYFSAGLMHLPQLLT